MILMAPLGQDNKGDEWTKYWGKLLMGGERSQSVGASQHEYHSCCFVS